MSHPTHIGALALLAAALLAPVAGRAQDAQASGQASDQTPAEIAAIDLLNRVQLERSREDELRRAQAAAETQAQYDAYQRELEHSQQLQLQYEMQMQEQARMEAEYQRALQEHARIQAACAAGDKAVCDAAWLALGLTPPGPVTNR